jgi:hypothetical protein
MELNFKNRHSSQYFFNIDETPVLYDYGIEGIKRYINKKVIINTIDQVGISIVPSNFYAVEHKKAFHLGVKIFEMLFGVSPSIQTEKSNKTEYRVDLTSEDCKIIFDKNGYSFYNGIERTEKRIDETSSLITSRVSENFSDEYYPFLRVSNFLRSGRNFRIELGYYRYRCSNGLLMGKKTKMIFTHTYYNINNFRVIEEKAFSQFLANKSEILNLADNLLLLLSIYVSRAQIRMISFDIFEKEFSNVSESKRHKFHGKLNDIVDKYVNEIGENLNAAVNVATEFSQELEGNKISPSKIQQITSDWIYKITKKKFNFEKYMYSIRNIEEKIMASNN